MSHALYPCVVIFFWSSGIMGFMLFTFENRFPLYAQGGWCGGASFITIDEQFQEVAIFPTQFRLPGEFCCIHNINYYYLSSLS